MKKKPGLCVLGVDPGNEGAFVLTDGEKFLETFPMPILTEGKTKRIFFQGVYNLLLEIGPAQIFLERAVPMAMGSKGAFSYGRGFEAIIIAIELAAVPYTLVEPQKWAREMCAGIRTDLRPKARSLIAARRLYPQLVGKLPVTPRSKKIHDGCIDALLVAGYGLRQLGRGPELVEEKDFY